VTPFRFCFVLLLYHAAATAIAIQFFRKWHAPRGVGNTFSAGRFSALISMIGLVIVAAALAAMLPNVNWLSRLRLGSIVARLLGQFVFGEAVALCVWELVRSLRLRRFAPALSSSLLGVVLIAVYWEGYRREPGQLFARHHVVDRIGGRPGTSVRILHISDIQTPTIGAHEERALREGLATRPDVIVFTGDYVQDRLGIPSEDRAAADLRQLMRRIGFTAPLGVFATEGDVGPDCAAVFAGTNVRCLANTSVILDVPGAGSLGVVGLTRASSRARDTASLTALLAGQASHARHRVIVAHAPDFVDALPPSAGVDLILAGHTHGGQVVLPVIGPLLTASRLPRAHAGGLSLFGEYPLHVTRGVGMERAFAPPVRFLCPPEICVIELRLPTER
jgi:predicted MPP superfamily phosphohydrolase